MKNYILFHVIFLGLFSVTHSLFAEERHLEDFLSRLKKSGENQADHDENVPNPFQVTVRCSHPDNTYNKNENISILVKSEKKGYVYIRDEKNQLIFPNDYVSNNVILPGVEQVYPPPEAPFNWKFDGKKSEERLTLYVSETPWNSKDLVTSLKESIVMHSITFHIRNTSAPETEFTTPAVEPEPTATPAKNRFSAMFIQTHLTHAVSGEPILDENIPFRIGNSILMRHALIHLVKCQELALVTGPDLTKNNIRQTFKILKEKTKPGDEIFIYWESHGGPMEGAGNPDDEDDHVNEVLLLASAKVNPDSNESSVCDDDVLTDDEFANLVTSLQDRKVIIIMEACFSGGMVSTLPANRLHRAISSLDSNEMENIRNFMVLLSNQTKNLQPIWNQSSDICNYNDVPMNQMIISNRLKNTRVPFASKFMQKTKDIHSNQKNIAMFMSAAENQSSWCALVNPNTKKIFTLKCGTLDNEDCIFPIGAPVYAFLLVILDKQGKFTSVNGVPTFDDFNKIAQGLIPANNARIVRLNPEANGKTQTPRCINNIGKIRLTP